MAEQVRTDWLSLVKESKAWRDVVPAYADAIRHHGQDGADYWGPVNAAIRERWSASTLIKIKREAWKAVQC